MVNAAALEFDTLAATRELVAAGLARQQTEAIAVTVRAGLAMKTDLDSLEVRLNACLDAKISGLETRMLRVANRHRAGANGADRQLDLRAAQDVRWRAMSGAMLESGSDALAVSRSLEAFRVGRHPSEAVAQVFVKAAPVSRRSRV